MQSWPKRLKYKGPISIDSREKGSHVRGLNPAKDTSRMGTARVEQAEGATEREK